MFLVNIYVFSILPAACYAIAVEYYDDYDLQATTLSPGDVNQTLGANATTARRSGLNLQKHQTSIINKVQNKPIDEDYESDDDFKIFIGSHRGIKGRQKMKNIVSQKTTVDFSTTELHITPISKGTSNRKFARFTMKDYEYIYDDSTTPRIQMLQAAVVNTTEILDVPDRVENDSKVYYTDFFNLAPAAVMPETNQNDFPNKQQWYVPEIYPCWELPVLYGELGKGLRTWKELFIIKRATLKNVIILAPKKMHKAKYYELPAATAYNKWCEVEPCYGDHTLCLFSDNTVSKICDSNYRVKEPTILEQIALVNTVNAMRNRVAIGAAEEYIHLPTASNMKQIMYDYDLEKMAAAWLRQCLPGPPPCSALDGHYVTQLECTKYANLCCVKSYKMGVTTSKW